MRAFDTRRNAQAALKQVQPERPEPKGFAEEETHFRIIAQMRFEAC